jgi:hypothetical protein
MDPATYQTTVVFQIGVNTTPPLSVRHLNGHFKCYVNETHVEPQQQTSTCLAATCFCHAGKVCNEHICPFSPSVKLPVAYTLIYLAFCTILH